jgi:hypothetical protein
MELHYHTDRELRERELAERMAERRRRSLAVTRRFLRARMARMLFALAVAVEKHAARRLSSEARSRT